MKESDYILVTALQRLRAAYDLLVDSRACEADEGLEKPLRDAFMSVAKMINRLERKAEEAMEEDES